MPEEGKMSSCLEFEGKAVDKAVQKASEELNIPKEKLKYNVISYGSSGIFGLVGVKKAKISVILPKEMQKSEPSSCPQPDAEKADMEAEDTAEAEEKFADKEDSEDSESVVSGENEKEDIQDSDSAPATFFTSTRKAPFPPELIQIGREALQRIIDFITTGAEIFVEEEEDRILFNVKGGTAGVLIGKQGQTLEAIQYLVEKIINKNSQERIRIQVDVEGYLDSRKANLENLARRLADKTKNTGKPSTIGQMNAHDRRIIHLALKDDARVRTQSIGDGFYRKLVIFPKRKNFRKKKHY
jgi:spoIIIJ-associated protein